MEESHKHSRAFIVLFLSLFIVYAMSYSCRGNSDFCSQDCCKIGSKNCVLTCDGSINHLNTGYTVTDCYYDKNGRLVIELGSFTYKFTCTDLVCTYATTTTLHQTTTTTTQPQPPPTPPTTTTLHQITTTTTQPLPPPTTTTTTTLHQITTTTTQPLPPPTTTTTTTLHQTTTTTTQATTTTAQTTTTTTTPCGNLKILNYNDLDGDGLQETSEAGIFGTYFNVTGNADHRLQTDPFGYIYILCTPPGNYAVWEEVPSGWRNTTDNPQQIPILQGLTSTVKFGNIKQTTTTTTTTSSTTTTTTTTQATTTTTTQPQTTTTIPATSTEPATTLPVVTTTTLTPHPPNPTSTEPTTSKTTTTLYTTTRVSTTSTSAITTVASTTNPASTTTTYSVTTLASSTTLTTLLATTTQGSTTTTAQDATTLSGGSSTQAVTTTNAPSTTRKQADTTTAPEKSATTTLNPKNPADTQPVDTLNPISQDTRNSRTLESGSEPVADAGGPYSAITGAPVVFDGSNSAAAGRIVNYIWSFGDDSYGKGVKTNHTYKSEGTYRVTLSVTDESGKASSDSKIVHIDPSELNVKIATLPKDDDGIYEPGESFNSIEVTVTYPDGTPVEKAKLSGIISGKTTQSLKFLEYGNGTYRMDKEYYILNPAPPFIDIYVNATDQAGNTGKGLKKLRTVRDDSESRIIMNDPSPNKVLVAYGEPLPIRLKLFSSKGPVEEGNIYMYEVQTNNKYQFKKSGDEYALDYRVPWEIGKRLNLIFYASYEVNDVNYQAVLEKSFDISADLKVKTISLENTAQTPNVTQIKLTVTYPAGEEVRDEQLNAVIDNTTIPLQKTQDKGNTVYLGNYSLRKGETKQYIWVTDSSGNGGGTYLQPGTDTGSTKQDIDPRTLMAAAAFIAISAAFLVVIRIRHKKKQKRMQMIKEYEDQHQKIESLKKIRKNIMHEYYTRKVSETDARKRILDTEKDMVMERGKMKTLMQKLGMTLQEIEGKEELIDWITEKLKTGENIDLIKKGLKDLNIDPMLAEKIKKTLT